MSAKFLPIMSLILAGIFIESPAQKMKKIFNGKTLEGWVVPENNIWWSAGKGVLSVKNGPDRKGSILWTQQEYEDFVVQADFRFGEGKVDSGIFLRNDKQQIQIGISGSLKRDMTGSPYIPGKGYPVEAEGVKDLLKTEGWNTMKVQAKGNVYTVWLNGKEVMTYTSENAIEKGPIGLQLHPKNVMAIDFRNIKVGEI